MAKGSGMSLAEFTYPLMQAWDWWHLFATLRIQMQIGGSDQYGNIVTGADAVKIIRDSETSEHEKLPADTALDDPIGFTVPLLTDASGAKFGKSAGNAVWLDPVQTSAFDLYGYLVGRPDEDVERLLKLFTFLPLSEIEETMQQQKEAPSKRFAQHMLAYEVVRLVHGRLVAASTQQEHRTMFGGDVDTVPEDERGQSKGARTEEDGEYAAVEGHPTDPNNAPRIDMQLPRSLIMGQSIARILYAAGLATSTSDAQRVVTRKGAYVGGAPGQKANVNKGMSEHQMQFTPVTAWFPEDTRRFLIDGKILILRKGKHNLRVIEMVSDEEWQASGRKYPGQPFTGEMRAMSSRLREVKQALAAGENTPPSAETSAETSADDAEVEADEEEEEDEDEDEDEYGPDDVDNEPASEPRSDPDSQAIQFPPQYSERMQQLRGRYDSLKQELERKKRSHRLNKTGGHGKGRPPSWVARGRGLDNRRGGSRGSRDDNVRSLREFMARDADQKPGW
jgi:tyrosyl-tRNA synthetase